MSEEQKCPECKKGAPDWMVTFSDLMTLLLTFFVLLLSMATVDTPKFEKTATSLHEAFSGIRVIGKPQQIMIEIPEMVPANKKVKVEQKDQDDQNMTNTKDYDDPTKIREQIQQELQQQMQNQQNQEQQEKINRMLEYLEEAIQDSLTKEIDTGIAEVEKKQDQILIRFPSEATFQSGSADLNPKMRTTFEKLGRTLKGMNIETVVTGHTDDVPISTPRFRSNWDLSAARASTIAMELQNFGELTSDKIEVVGFADGIPIAPNDSPENRRINRRIEVFIEPSDERFDEQVFEEIVGTVESTTFKSSGDLPDSIKTQKPTKPAVESDSLDVKKPDRLQEIIERIRSFRRRR